MKQKRLLSMLAISIIIPVLMISLPLSGICADQASGPIKFRLAHGRATNHITGQGCGEIQGACTERKQWKAANRYFPGLPDNDQKGPWCNRWRLHPDGVYQQCGPLRDGFRAGISCRCRSFLGPTSNLMNSQRRMPGNVSCAIQKQKR